MKQNETTGDNDAQLRSVLREWVVDEPLPPGFQDQVWKRIARAETRFAPGFWAAVLRFVEAALPRPKVAISYMAALLVLGVAAGSLTAQIRTSRVNSALGVKYVQSIDPYRAEMTGP